jgi:DNA-binding NarL/FixJ family response regulator
MAQERGFAIVELERTFYQEMVTMFNKTRILIVDDNPSFRKAIRALLEIQPDMEVAGEARCGSAAMESLEEFQPDLILLDAKMPGMTGFEVTR